MLRVAIVDDDRWVREGRAAALERTGLVAVAFVDDHETALDRATWDDVDVVLLDAHDPDADFDRFVGVRVVEQIRRAAGGTQPRIAVLTGHASNDLLRIRMAEAGADVMHQHADVRTVEDLVAIVDGTATGHDPTADAARQRAGLTGGGRVNDAVSWAQGHLDEDTLDEGAPQKSLGISRRQLITARERISGLAGLRPLRRGDRARLPEWRDVTHFLQRARGAERRSQDPDTD